MVHVSFFIDPYVISIKLREPKRDASEPSIDFRPCQEPRGGTAQLGVIRQSGGATVQPTAAQQPHKEAEMAYPRAVILRHALGAIGHDDELFTDPSLVGLTVAWLPGDQGLTILVGGGTSAAGAALEPALSVFVHHLSVPRLLALVERMVSLTPVIGAPEPFLETLVDHPTRWNEPPREDYDPAMDPFTTTNGLEWHRHARCIALAQGSFFATHRNPDEPRIERDWVAESPGGGVEPVKKAAEDPFRSELDQEDDGPFGTVPHPEDPAGWSGRITAYPVDSTGWRPDEQRGLVVDFAVDGRLRVYLNKDEAADLLPVLRHRPGWAA